MSENQINKKSLWFVAGVAVVAVVAIVWAILASGGNDGKVLSGTVSEKTPIENYIPVVDISGGIYTTLPIFTTSSSTVGGRLDVSGVLNAGGTTTIANSSDGFTAGGGIAPSDVATGTALTLYTHAGGRSVCKGTVGAAYADSTGYSPAFQFSVGTTSGSTVNEASLISTTTLATTTDEIKVASTPTDYILEAGDTIVAYLADGDSSDGNTAASTTNFANWDIEFQNVCWNIGG